MIVMVALGFAAWFAVYYQNIQAEREWQLNGQLVRVYVLKWAGTNNQERNGGTYGSFSECATLAAEIRNLPSMRAWCETITGNCYGKSCADGPRGARQK